MCKGFTGLGFKVYGSFRGFRKPSEHLQRTLDGVFRSEFDCRHYGVLSLGFRA